MPATFRIPTVLTPTEARALLKACNVRCLTGQRDQCLLALMLHAGLRVSEALALTEHDIDWDSGQLHVRQGKGKKDRILWLGAAMLQSLKAWRARKPAPSTPLLFTTLQGEALHSSQVRTMVKRRARKAGLTHKDIHPHTLRHTFATELYRQTKNIRLVQKALGHQDLSTTMIYTHLVDDDYQAALQGLQL
jgi:integrase/recombinase XerD